MDTLYDFNYASPTAVDRQEYTDVGAAAFYLGTCPRAFLGGTDFEIWTAAVGGTQLTEGVDYTISQNNARGDVFYSRQSGETVYSDVTIDNVTYQTGSIFITYKIIGSYITAETLNGVIDAIDTLEYDRVHPGMQMAWPTTAAIPAGWDVSDGALVSRTGAYSRVFAVYGTLYGAGDGATTFNLPPFQGYALRGYAAGVSAAIGTAQADAMQGHFHDDDTSTSDTNYSTGTRTLKAAQLPIVRTDTVAIVKGPITDGTNGTPRIDSETRMKNYAVQWIIKL